MPDFDQVVLQVRGRKIAARLVDTSVTGLGVICDPAVSVQAGEQLKVSTDTGWFRVTVARVAATPEGQLLGLERGAEDDGAKVGRRTESRIVAIVFAAIVLAMPILTAAWTFCRPQRPRAAKSSQPAQLVAPLPDSTDLHRDSP